MRIMNEIKVKYLGGSADGECKVFPEALGKHMASTKKIWVHRKSFIDDKDYSYLYVKYLNHPDGSYRFIYREK